VAEALQFSQYNIYGYRGTFADYSERSSLSRAQVAANQVEMLIEQAKRIQPEVKSIGPIRIASENLVGDILFNNVLDNDLHQLIETSGRELLDAAHNIKREIKLAQKREKTARQELAEVTGDLETSRKALQRVRAETVARVLGLTVTSTDAAPPSYEQSSAPPSYATQ
jgi:hypothetical protein